MTEHPDTGHPGAVDRIRREGAERARAAAHALLHTDLTPAEVTEHALILAEEFLALDGRTGEGELPERPIPAH